MIFMAQAYQILTAASAIPITVPAGADAVVVYDDATLSAVQTSNNWILAGLAAVFALMVFTYFRNRRGGAIRDETPWPMWATAAFLVGGVALSALFAALIFPRGADVLFEDVPGWLQWPFRIGFGLLWPAILLAGFRPVLPFGYRKRLYKTLGALDLTLFIVASGGLCAFNVASHISKLPRTTRDSFFALGGLLAITLAASIVGFLRRTREPAAPQPPESSVGRST